MRLLVLVLVLLAACDDVTSTSPTPDAGVEDDSGSESDARGDARADSGTLECEPGEVSAYEGGGWRFELAADGAWTATAGDVVLRGPSPCANEVPVRRMTGEPAVKNAFGNFQIDLTATSATWSNPSRVRGQSRQDGLQIDYTFNGGEASLVLRDDGVIALESDAPGGELAIRCDPTDGFFGLGSQATGMDLKGRTYPLWTQEQGNGKKEDGGLFPFNNTLEAAYAPMGVLHATAGWTALVTHDAYSEVELCTDGLVRLRSYKGQPGWKFGVGTPKDRMKFVADHVGTPGSVPDWVFGLWLDAVGGPWRIDTVASALRDNGIPASAIWTEDWIGGESTATGYRLSYAWEWDATFYPDLPAQIAALHDDGFAFLAYFNPFVPKPTRMFTEGSDNGYLIQNSDGTPTVFADPAFRDASLVDLTNPAALEWLKGYQTRAVTELGIDGWMADFAEWLPVTTHLSNGQDPWTYHNPYPVAWQRANREALEAARPDGNWTFFVRSGWASMLGGTGGVAPLFWGGDQNTNWAYDDGFPTVIPIGAHVGLSGVPIYGSDIAGYNSVGGVPTTTKELWFRWLATAAFHPLMRTHHGGMECENWHFDRDAESVAHMRRWASVHAMLFPTFKMLLGEANAQGLPITRHPWLVEPNSPALWQGDNYQFFLGDDVLIAPVLVEGATQRTVLLPAAGWWPLFGTQPAAEATPVVDATPSEIPVFVRPGTALVVLSEAPASFYGGNVTGLADVQGLRVALYADANGLAAGEGAGVSVVASGLEGFDPSNSSMGGQAIGACNPSRQTCFEDGLLKLRCDGTCEVTSNSATLTVVTANPTTLWLGIGGAAWGDVATPGTFTASEEVGNWCEARP